MARMHSFVQSRLDCSVEGWLNALRVLWWTGFIWFVMRVSRTSERLSAWLAVAKIVPSAHLRVSARFL